MRLLNPLASVSAELHLLREMGRARWPGLGAALQLVSPTAAGKLLADLRAGRSLMQTAQIQSPTELRLDSPVSPWFAQLLWKDSLPVRASGGTVWDAAGNAWSDLFADGGRLIHGHGNKALQRALHRAMRDEVAGASAVPNVLAIALQERLVDLVSPVFSRAIVCESEDAALGCAIELSRRISGHTEVRSAAGLGPELALPEPTAALIVEPVTPAAQPDPARLRDLAERCKQGGGLVIADERRSGMGRCGALLAHPDHFQADLAVIGGALSGGIVPIGVCLCSEACWERAIVDADAWAQVLQRSAVPLACAAAMASLDLLQQQDLAARAAEGGRILRAALAEALVGVSEVQSFGGAGLLLGIRLDRPALMAAVALARRERMIVGLDARALDCLLISPPLSLEREQLEAAASRVGRCLRSLAAGD